MSNFMMNMISWVLLLLVILTLYLIDKVNHLAKMYEAPTPQTPSLPEFEPEAPGDLLFSGLEGKKLWDEHDLLGLAALGDPHAVPH